MSSLLTLVRRNWVLADHCRATVIVLYRPYIAKGPAHPEEAVEEYWRMRSLDKTRSAAANTSRILESLVEMNLVKYMKSMALVDPFCLALLKPKD